MLAWMSRPDAADAGSYAADAGRIVAMLRVLSLAFLL